MKRSNDYQLTMPFGESFAENWDIWKKYKWASHNFKYKSVFSEQAALEQLVTLSSGDEEKAIKIIKQSLRREWQGLFPLHETTTGNGTKKQSASDKGSDGVKNSAVKEFIRRNGGGESQASGDHLKAV